MKIDYLLQYFNFYIYQSNLHVSVIVNNNNVLARSRAKSRARKAPKNDSKDLHVSFSKVLRLILCLITDSEFNEADNLMVYIN